MPRVELEAYKCCIPKLVLVTNPGAIEEARGRLALGESLYLDTALRGKDAGYKIVESFKRINLWEEILQSKSPERALRER